MAVVPVAVGLLMAGGVGIFATGTGLDRDRAFYPTVLIVIASYYCLFAVMGGGSLSLLGIEVAMLLVFAALAVLGFQTSLWVVVAGLAAHGLFDLVRGALPANAGVPAWWPAWCFAYDITAAAYLAWLLVSRQRLRS